LDKELATIKCPIIKASVSTDAFIIGTHGVLKIFVIKLSVSPKKYLYLQGK